MQASEVLTYTIYSAKILLDADAPAFPVYTCLTGKPRYFPHFENILKIQKIIFGQF